MARAAQLVDHDAVVHPEPRLLGELDAGKDAQPRDDDFRGDLGARGGAHDAGARARLEPGHPLAHPHGHALLPVVVDEKSGQV